MEKLLALSVLALTVFGSTLGACDRLRGLGNRVRTGCPRMGRAAGSFGSICSPRLVGTAVFRAASANLLPSALASAHWPTRTGQRTLAVHHDAEDKTSTGTGTGTGKDGGRLFRGAGASLYRLHPLNRKKRSGKGTGALRGTAIASVWGGRRMRLLYSGADSYRPQIASEVSTIL